MINFSIKELCKSPTAVKLNLNNTPYDLEVQDNLLYLITEVLQPLRERLQKPIIVTSGYRSLALNKAIGGVKNSQHLKGQAADIHVPSMSISDLFNFIKDSGIEYDQLINEYDQWIHVSYNKKGNRKKAFKL